MTKSRILFFAATLCAATGAFGQSEMQLHVRRQSGWDPRSREGRCEIRLWVDNRAEVRLRGDAVFVRTVEGAKGRDEGSECSQPLPFNSVRGFQIRQTAGRNRVELAQEPSRMNNFTAMFAIDDRQGGGDNYAFEVTWQAETDVAAAPAPFFDDVRACQDAVRQRFAAQNGRGAYIDFETFADRRNSGQGRGPDSRDARDGPANRNGRNTGRESITGRGNARSPGEARDLTYSCDVDTRQNQVMSGSYNYTGEVQRGSNNSFNRRPLR
jgi:hypothetical protein